MEIKCTFAATCQPLSLSKGRVDYNRLLVHGVYLVDTTAYFECYLGYFLNGYDSIICQSSGNWSQQIPICNLGTILIYIIHIPSIYFVRKILNYLINYIDWL